jgi:hypothetical protein
MRRKDPQTKKACLADWLEWGNMNIPTSGSSGSRDVKILRLVEASSLNGLPIDFLITALTEGPRLPLEFAVVFSHARPPDGKYPLPILWRKMNGPSPGVWVKPAPRF